jgi:hypothetical protein
LVTQRKLRQLVRWHLERSPGRRRVAALVLSQNPALRWDEVRDVLRRSCDRIDDTPGEYDRLRHSTRYGYGRVNAQAAVELAERLASGVVAL